MSDEVVIKRYPAIVRLRKGMYISSLEQMVYEIVDNGIDEINAKRATAVALSIINGVVTVEDDGKGIPVEKSTDPEYSHLTQAEVAYIVLHAGGKFGDAADHTGKTGGLHGVGASVVNALAEYTTVTSTSKGKRHQASFSRGVITENMHLIESNIDPEEHGTVVVFKQDDEIWGEERYNLKKIAKRMQQLAYLNPTATIYCYIDDVDKEGNRIQIEETYHYPEGLVAYVDKLTKKKIRITDTISLTTTINDMDISVAFAYTDAYTDEIYSFCNNIFTPEGGDHMTGFKMGLAKAITTYAEQSKAYKDLKINSDDALEGIAAIVSAKVFEPEFEGQGKAKIKMPALRTATKDAVEQAVFDFLDHNPDQANIILEKVSAAVKAREAAKKARENSRKNKDLIEGGLPGKIADCSSKNPEECEIYIVEGDSAGGSAKQARDRKFQAILPIFGKPMNVEKQRLEKVLENLKLGDLARALKCGILDEFDESKLRYHKIIIMSDADVDGAHIKTLYLTYFYRYMRQVIEKGYLYFSCPPLYKITKGKTVRYAYSDKEKEQILAELGGSDNIQRYKGLGEMNADQLWDTTMNPETRMLEQITIDDIEEDEAMIALCMGDEVPPRKELIIEHSHEANLDV